MGGKILRAAEVQLMGKIRKQIEMTTVNSQVRQMVDIDLGPGLCKLLIGDTAHSRRLGTKFSLTLKFNQHSISNNKRGKAATKSKNKVSLTVVEDLSSVQFGSFVSNFYD